MGAAGSVPESVSETSIHDFTVKDCRGRDVDLSIYKGKVLLVVNIATNCLTRGINLGQLTKLHNKLKGEDFEILAFPCNQFLRQESRSSLEAKDFACTKYKSEYPIFQKVRVNGPRTAPVFKFLKATKKGIIGHSIEWNFTKFLVDKNGKVINRYWVYKFALSIEADIRKALEGY